MRIGIDCRAYGSSHGYMGKYIKNIISFLMENEDTNEYTLFLNDQETGETIPNSPRFHQVKIHGKWRNFSEQLLFPYKLHQEKFDVILFSQPNIPFLYFGKSIIILSDLVPYFYPERQRKWVWAKYWQNYIFRKSIRNSSTVIVFSEVLKRDITEIFDTPEEKIQVIPPMCFETKRWKETEVQQFLSKECISEKYFLFVGELREYKNIPRLLQAYSLLIKEDESFKTSWEQNIPIDLVLIGKENPTYHEIRSTLIQLGLQNLVHIYNVLAEEKIGFLYQNALFYILPSLYEGSEEAILSPLSYNLPIVSSLIPSITTVLEKDDALFFRPMSIPEITEALKKALSHPPQKRSTINLSIYSTPSIVAKLLDLFSLYKRDTSPKKQ